MNRRKREQKKESSGGGFMGLIKKSGSFLSRGSSRKKRSGSKSSHIKLSHGRKMSGEGINFESSRRSTGIIGKYFSGMRSSSKSKRNPKKKGLSSRGDKNVGVFTRKSDRDNNLQFFQKRKKVVTKVSIIPKNLDLENAAVIINKKRSRAGSMIIKNGEKIGDLKSRKDSRRRVSRRSFSRRKGTQPEINHLLDPKKSNTIENSKDFIKNFLRKKEKNEEISKLSEYVSQVNTDIDDIVKKEKKAKKQDKPVKPSSARGGNRRSFRNLFMKTTVPEPKKPMEMSMRIRPSYYMKSLEYYYLMEKKDYFSDLYKKHFSQSFSSMKFVKLLKKRKADQFIKENKLTLKRNAFSFKKKTIIFDLDETLIHCSENNIGDNKLSIPLQNGENLEASFFIRPYVKDCLDKLSNHFELIVFTASHKCYADRIIDVLDPKKKFVSHRIFREHCFQSKQGVYIKDLRIINRNMKDVILVDNAAYSFAFQVNNGVPIIPFYNSTEDAELLFLTEFIMTLKDVDDVRPYLKSIFKFEQYTSHAKIKDCFNGLFKRKK